MRNKYALDLRLEGTTHVFADAKERDAWVDANWAKRNQIDSDDARNFARTDGLCICHGDAKPPKSWGIWLRDTPYDDGSLYWMWR